MKKNNGMLDGKQLRQILRQLPPRKEPIVLEDTDHECWIELKRDWFEQAFLSIFQLKDALTKKGIAIDYPELLIKAGDVWQFVCFEVSPARFSVRLRSSWVTANAKSLLRTASYCSFSKIEDSLDSLSSENVNSACQRRFETLFCGSYRKDLDNQLTFVAKER